MVRTRRGPYGTRPIHDATRDSMQHQNDNERPWKLIHDDPFDRARTDEELAAIVATYAARSAQPYGDVLRALVGLEDMEEGEARAFFERVLEHRRRLAKTLGRAVHVRVAALDMLTTRPPKTATRHDSHPLVVTSSLLEKALEEATLDTLTGLPQRGQFMNLLRHELRQRKRRSLTVAFLDLDGFKRVNDEHGHARGDEVLQALARSARVVLRQGDVLARLGGDEFAVLLLDASPEEADAAIGRLREHFEEMTATYGTSFSAGIATATPGEPAEALLMRADDAMYRQKRARHAAASG